MDTITCVICGIRDEELLFRGRDRELKIEDEYNLVRCRRCGLLYVNPQPDNEKLSQHYSADYSVFRENNNFLLQELKKIYYLFEKREIGGFFTSGGNVLEVGCGQGEFLKMLAKVKKYRVKGVEPSEIAVQKARRRIPNVQIIHGTIFDGNFKDGEFDCVIMRYTLEHLKNPSETIKEVQRILKKGGIFTAAIPNAASWENWTYGRYWSEFDFPRHLTIFSQVTIKRWLEKRGFQILKIKHITMPFGWIRSFLLLLKEKFLVPSKFLDLLPVKNIFFIIIFLPISLVSKLFSRSGRIKVFAVKR